AAGRRALLGPLWSVEPGAGQHGAAAHHAGRARRRIDARRHAARRPRVHGPLRPRRARAAERIRASRTRGDPDHSSRPVAHGVRDAMSRIQEILNKAEREGTVRRTRGLSENSATATAAPAVPAARVTPPAFEAGAAAPWTSAATAPSLDDDLPDVTTAAPTLDARLVAALAPQSPPAERYRLLRTRVKRAENGR